VGFFGRRWQAHLGWEHAAVQLREELLAVVRRLLVEQQAAQQRALLHAVVLDELHELDRLLRAEHGEPAHRLLRPEVDRQLPPADEASERQVAARRDRAEHLRRHVSLEPFSTL
jgi:hypothetical protein